MGFGTDLLNTLIADLTTKNGGDRYLMYMLFRDDIASRRSAENIKKMEQQAMKRREEFEKENRKFETRIKVADARLKEAKIKAIKANERYKAVVLSTVGCKSLQEMCEKLDLKTVESWNKFIDVMPDFKVFTNEFNEIYNIE